MNYGRCTEHIPFFDQMTNETYCQRCGYELPPELSNSRSKKGLMPIDQFNVGLTTSFNTSPIDSNGKYICKSLISGLSDTAKRVTLKGGNDRNKFKGTVQLQRIVNLLEIPPHVEKLTRDTFIEFSDKGYLKGKNLYSCLYCILLITATNLNYPLTLGALIKVTPLARKKFNSDYHQMYRRYQSAPRFRASRDSYIEKNLSFIDCHWKNYKAFKIELGDLAMLVSITSLSGRRASIAITAIMYRILQLKGYHDLQGFTRQSGISKTSIAGYLDTLKNEGDEQLRNRLKLIND